VLPVMDRGDFERVIAAARAAMGAAAFARAYAKGGTLTPDEMVAEAAAGTADRPFPPDAVVPNGVKLAPRELDVLRLLIEGQRDADIARELSVSPRTIHGHVAAMLVKLGVPSRTALAVHAIRRGLV
jgi:DNA-binding NarL/FixJ family response regulator